MADKRLVPSVLNYACSVEDPLINTLQDESEKEENRAARFVPGIFSYETRNMTGIFEHLKW